MTRYVPRIVEYYVLIEFYYCFLVMVTLLIGERSFNMTLDLYGSNNI